MLCARLAMHGAHACGCPHGRADGACCCRVRYCAWAAALGLGALRLPIRPCALSPASALSPAQAPYQPPKGPITRPVALSSARAPYHPPLAPADPKLCKYTVEGTLVHEIMNNVKLLERREKTMYEGLQYKLTEKEKKEIIANSVAFLTAQNNKVRLRSFRL